MHTDTHIDKTIHDINIHSEFKRRIHKNAHTYTMTPTHNAINTQTLSPPHTAAKSYLSTHTHIRWSFLFSYFIEYEKNI